MGNNNFGEFAGSFATAFTSQLQAKKEQERLDKMAKLQGQLVTMQLQGAKTKQEAQTQVADMMGGTTISELAPAPPTQTPGGRDVPQFTGGGAPPMGPAEMVQSPEGLSALMAAGQLQFSDLIPKASARQNSKLEQIAWAEANNIELSDDEKKQFLFQESDPDAFWKAQLVKSNLAMVDEKVAAATAERKLNEKTEGERVRGLQVDTRSALEHTREIFDLQQRLEGTLLASGTPMNEAIRDAKAGQFAFMQALNLNPSEQLKLINDLDDYDRLTKLFAVGTMTALDRVKDQVGETKFQELRKSVADPSKTARANNLLQADLLKELLRGAEIQGIEIAEREEIEEFIKVLKSTRTKIGEAAVDLPAVADEAKKKVGRFIVEEVKQ